jgi:adenosylcobinamide kinase/adenosylcobinamide-phosphate guanylyltransferase
MIFVVGGEGSGKLDFVRSLGYSEDEITEKIQSEKPVLNHLERIIAQSPEKAEDMFGLLLKKEVVICNEVGSGVIPAKREETLCRKATGKLCILLANEAKTVVRMVCGIPTVLKGKI